MSWSAEGRDSGAFIRLIRLAIVVRPFWPMPTTFPPISTLSVSPVESHSAAVIMRAIPYSASTSWRRSIIASVNHKALVLQNLLFFSHRQAHCAIAFSASSFSLMGSTRMLQPIEQRSPAFQYFPSKIAPVFSLTSIAASIHFPLRAVSVGQSQYFRRL